MKDLASLLALSSLPAAHDPAAAEGTYGDWQKCTRRKAHPAVHRLVAAMAGNSPYLADLIVREADFFAESLSRPIAQSLATIHSALAGPLPEDEEAVMTQLRVAKRQLALLAATADIAGLWSVQDVTGALSDFADHAASVAARFLLLQGAARGEIELPDSKDPERGSGLVLLGMGKLGAKELNYSSDIDLIVFYDEEVVRYTGRRTAQDFFVKVAQGLVRLLGQRTEDGYVFRTDLRLRPDPGSTPVALSLAAAENYYESFGQNWERAAMIKARAIAGDKVAGDAFLQRLAPFVWRRHLDFAAIEDIQSIKRQIHAHKGHAEVKLVGHNIKLGRGGIREIEFFAQTQQLIAGGRDPRLRTRATCDAIRALAETNRTEAAARDDLLSAYEYLRRLEHRLQMVRDEQTHSIPLDDDGIERIAVFMAFADRAAFERETIATLERVKTRYDELFAEAAPLGSGGSLVFTGTEDDPDTLQTLSGLGFSDPPAVAATIRGWHHGRYRAMRSERAREMLTALMPRLLEAMSHAASPDAAFARFDEFLGRLPAGIQVFSLFHANPAILDLVAEVLGTAPRLAEHLGRNPQLFDALLSEDFFRPDFEPVRLDAELGRLLSSARDYQDVLDLSRRWVNDHRVRLGVLLLRGAMDAVAIGRALSAITDTVLRRLYPAVEDEHARAHGRVPGGGMVVIGLGKLGSREMTLESDLDLIFVYDHPAGIEASDGPRPLPPQPYFARLSQRFISALTALTAEGRLFEVDMRLRPSGNAGPIATDLAGFKDYQLNSAWTWEHMALTRARIIHGPDAVKRPVDVIIRTVLRQTRDDARLLGDIASMRRRIAESHPPKSRWSLKYAEGGIVDIEFMAQYLQLKHAAAHPDILQGNTLAVFETAANKRLLGAEVAHRIIGAGQLQANLAGVIRLAQIGEFDPETAGRGLRDLLTRIGSAKDFEDLTQRLIAAQNGARSAFDMLIESKANAEPLSAPSAKTDDNTSKDTESEKMATKKKVATKAKTKTPSKPGKEAKGTAGKGTAGSTCGPSVGDAAPAFDMAADGGGKVSLKDFRGQKLVLYFYPKDNTSGCTKEAIDFSTLAKEFAKAGTKLLGCSKDSVASHDGFKKKFKLALQLGADEAGKTCESYGVWVEKSMYGRKYMGIERATFLIDTKGKIAAVWRKVKVPGHAAEVLAEAKKCK